MNGKIETSVRTGSLYRYASILVVIFAVTISTGCTTYHIRRDVSQNPLPKMAQFAQANGYKVVEWNGTDHLSVKKNVNWFMLLALRRDRFAGDFDYRDGVLDADLRVEMRNIFWYVLCIPPATMDINNMFSGVTPSPRRCANKLFRGGWTATRVALDR